MRPVIGYSRIVSAWAFGPYAASLHTEILAAGGIRYLFAISFDRDGEDELWVTVEQSPAMAALPELEHAWMLCYFLGGSHHNIGMDADWANRDAFVSEAFTLAGRVLQVTNAPAALPLRETSDEIGLYPDPLNTASRRFWNGDTWTSLVVDWPA